MRNFILLVGILLFINCQYSKRIVNDTSYERTVTIDVATASLGEESKWFSEKTRSEIEEINLLKEEGKNILAQVVARYKNQIGDC